MEPVTGDTPELDASDEKPSTLADAAGKSAKPLPDRVAALGERPDTFLAGLRHELDCLIAGGALEGGPKEGEEERSSRHKAQLEADRNRDRFGVFNY